MAEKTLLLSQFYIKIDGVEATADLMRALVNATVESSLHLPDAATLTMHDPGAVWIDHAGFAPGKTLQISSKVGSTEHKLFDGEIVELESDLFPGDRRVIVRAFDRLHRLARGRHVRSFVNATDGDMVRQLAQEVGLTSKVGPAKTVHPYVLQDNTTNLDFLRERAAMLGYLLYVEGNTLHCEEHGAHTATVVLAFNKDLSEFHLRQTTVDQVDSVSTSGWDPKTKESVHGKAERANGSPQIGITEPGGEIASKAYGFKSDVLVADRPIRDQTVADKLAQGTLDRRAGRFIEAEGVAHGNPELLAGVLVEIKEIGTTFSGKYFVTGATHTYGGDLGYVTRFTVSGFQPATLLSTLGPERDGGLSQSRVGLVIGVVTDNKDPDGLCRVKVKFPWLSDKHASDWARLVTPGGGQQRGMQFLPEVNDEVLVGFEQGNINFPYVLGGLWNGKDAPPIKSTDSKVLDGGKVNQRIIRSRSGHMITLDDSDNAPYIEIVDKTGKNTIKLDSKDNKLTIHVEGDMLLEAVKDISIKGKNITIEATDALKLKGKSLDAEAIQAANMKAGTDLKLKGTNGDFSADAGLKLKGGATAELKGSASLTLDGGAMTEVKGGMVKVG